MDPSTRPFLERVLPWDDPGVWRNLHYFYRPEDTHKVFTGLAFRTLDEFCTGVVRALNNPRQSDLYFCTSTQRMAEPKLNKWNNSYNKAVRNQDNAVQFKSLFVDVDVGNDASKYLSRDDAIKGLKQFVKALGVEPTIIVSSGSGGMHVYWTLTEAISRDEWQPYATALAMAAVKTGFKIDAACTIDAARVLRIPGTFNHKHDPKRPVTMKIVNGTDVPFYDLQTALEPYMGDVIQRKPTNLNNDLSAGIQGNLAPPINLDSVVPHCPFVAEAVTQGGKFYPEPLWHLSVCLSTFTEGGALDAHRMSSGHPDYSEEETQEKYERAVAEKEAKGLGWPQCATIMTNGCHACLSCPHLAKGKSPLNLGKPTAPPLNGTTYQAPLSTLPPGYALGLDGLIYKVTPAKDMHEQDRRELICSYPLSDGWIQSEPWTLHFFTRLTTRHQKKALQVPHEVAGNRNALMLCLGKQGMSITNKQSALLGDFLVNWIQRLREIKAAVLTSTPFGWHVEGGQLSGFAYGGKVYGANGFVPSAMPDFQVASRYTPKGDLQVWRDAAKILTDQKIPWINAILASSFASPLVRLTGYYGFMMSCYGDSGIGKSTAIEVAQMVWGSPKGVQGLSDTHLQASKLMGILKSLPVYWDEIKTARDAEQFVAAIFQLTRGQERKRLKSDTSFQTVGDWETLLVVASNESMIDHVVRGTKTTTAGIVRVFEFTARKSKTFNMDAGRAIRIVAKARENYGRAGEVYAQWIGENIDLVTREVAAVDEALRRKYGATEAERNWFGLIACLLLGLKYAIRLGLLDCDDADIQALKTFLLEEALPDMRKQSSNQNADLNQEVNVSEILSQFLRSMKARNTITTDEVQMQGRPGINGYRLLSEISRLDELKVHFGLNQHIVRFSVTAFHTWLTDHKYPVKVVIDAMTNMYAMRRSLGKLGVGTAVAWDVKANFYEIQNAGLLSPMEVPLAEQPTVEH